MSVYDAFIFGACVGFIAVFPAAILLHFVSRFLTHKRDTSDYYDDFP